MRVGDVIMIGKFDAVGDGIVASFKAPSRTQGYVFMFMGVQPRDGSEPLDLEDIMNQLGWTLKAKDE
jgi:hypothetical protein